MPDFPVNDRRHAAMRATAAGGVPLGRAPSSPLQARQLGLTGNGRTSETTEEQGMRRSRRSLAMARTAAGGTSGGGATINFATGRSRDPMWYWRTNNMPYDVTKSEELERCRQLMKLLYQTHPIFASAVDIFSKYPLVGMELTCKDNELTEFYNTLFMDQLEYEEFLIDVGRDYWTVGEAWPYGSFNELLGVWEDDECLNADDIDVHRTPFSKEPFFTMRLPQSIRDVLNKHEPQWEFQRLTRDFPELMHFMDDRKRMPVSNVLLKQLRFKVDNANNRGIPIGMRAIRAITQEEMMMSAQDAVADRLYTPLILARLGASAADLGTPDPWIPNDEDLGDFEEALDAALAGDFRVMVHHFAVQIETVFGREQMPNLTQDFDRLTGRILQTWGMSETMLSGAGQGETYAADALNRDLITQLLTSYQKKLKKLYKDRALVVAEAQRHYDYETRGGKRYPIMEEILVTDEETGKQRVEEQPKLLIPDLQMRTMNLQSEEVERQFYEALRASGVPISMKTRLINVPIDLDDEVEKTREEQVQLAIEDAETKKQIYLALKQKGLPIPIELKEMFDPKISNANEVDAAAAAGQSRIPTLGLDDPSTPALAPTGYEQEMPAGYPTPDRADLAAELTSGDPGQDPTAGGGQGTGIVTRLPRNRQRPPESDERRAGMPRASSVSLDRDPPVASLFRTPAHTGSRQQLDPEKPIDEQEETA